MAHAAELEARIKALEDIEAIKQLKECRGEIDRLKEKLKMWSTDEKWYQAELSKIEQRTKDSCVDPVWKWLCETLNTKGKTFQKAELRQAIMEAKE